MSRHVAVIGAGAAGLTAAMRAAEAGARVTLLNAHPKVGLKILMSGGTRCNVTHREVSERDFNGSPRFVRNILRAFPADRARAWLESLGVALKLEETGKYFPVTDNANTVLDALLAEVQRAGVTLVSGARVVRLIAGGTGAGGSTGMARGTGAGADVSDPPGSPAFGRFRIGIQRIAGSAAFGEGVPAPGRLDWPLPALDPDDWLDADAVVLATGGLSFPRTGSDGTGYALAHALGHTLVPPIPALTPLTAEDPLCERAQGVTLDVALTLWNGGRRAIAIRGSLLIAHFGYTGPAALDLSRHWLRADAERRVTASFAPDERSESLVAAWRDAAASEPRLPVRRLLARWVPDRLALVLCDEAGVDPATAVSQVPAAARSRAIEGLLERPLPITGTLGYEKAEVTAGGVTLAEVDPHTLESRIVPGLFLCGEVLDVEGRLGGFNFQFAWSSGTVAGRAASGRVLTRAARRT